MMNDFEQVKDAVDIVRYAERHMTVKRMGSHYKAVCVFHDDHDPSLCLYPDTCSYHCFACGANGDVFELAMKLHNLTKQQALIELAHEYHITLDPFAPLSEKSQARQVRLSRLYALLEASALWFYQHLNVEIIAYLSKERGLSPETIQTAGIGYAPDDWQALRTHLKSLSYTDVEMCDAGVITKKDDSFYVCFRNRVMIPMRSAKGYIVGFSGRALSASQTPKYQNTKETEIFNKGSLIYTPMLREKNTQGDAQSTFVVVEGHMDAISALNRGFSNVIAQMGTALTETQLNLLCRDGITRLVFCLDKDAAGRKALRTLVEKHAANAANKGVSLYAMFSPHGKDPDDCFREKPELWQPAVDAARPVVDVLIDLELSTLGERPSPAQLSNMARALLPVLKSDNPFVQCANIETLAARTGIAPSALQQWLTPQIHLLPKTTPAPKVDHALPCLEEWIIYSLIINDDAYWYERANAALDTVTTDTLAYALAPLSINDFQRKDTHAVMGQITRMVLDNDRPLYAALAAYFEGGNNQEMYQRLAQTEARSLISGGPPAMTYEEFVGAVYGLRVERLLRDVSDKRLDDAARRECSIGIALLRLTQEELI